MPSGVEPEAPYAFVAIIRAMPLTLRQRRDGSVIAVVVLVHGLALWGLHKASLGKPLQVIVPARMVAEFVTPAPPSASEAPVLTPQPPPAPPPHASMAAGGTDPGRCRCSPHRPDTGPTVPTLGAAGAGG